MTSRRSAVDVNAIIAEALAARDSGRPEAGIDAIRMALKQLPGQPQLWQVLGLLYRATENSAAAAEALAEAARLAPNDTRIAHAHARVTMEAGWPSLQLFERARKLAPFDGDLLISQAAAKFAEGRGQEAAEEIDAILSQNPGWLQGQELLANMRWALADYEHFTDGYERAICAEPGNITLWLAFASRLIHAGDFTALDKLLPRARRAVGNQPAFDMNEAIAASEIGDHPRADGLFNRLNAITDDAFAIRQVRHLLRTGRIETAASRAELLTGGAEAGQAWAYLAVAWRLLDDPRWQWLEGAPTLVGCYDDVINPESVTALTARLRSLHAVQGAPIGQSVHGGTQTDGPLFARADPEIVALRRAIKKAVQRHQDEMGLPDKSHPARRHIGKPFHFAGSWSVRLTGAGHHSNHIHQQGWLSAVFYVSIPPAGEMGAHPAGCLQLGVPPAELGLNMAPCRVIEPEPGRLVIFPSTMWHGTLPFKAGERLTVAFDVAPVG